MFESPRVFSCDPAFLNDYVFYSTYPQIWRIASVAGFQNETYKRRLEKARTLDGIKTQSSEFIGRMLKMLPAEVRVALAQWATHARSVFQVGIRLHLVK